MNTDFDMSTFDVSAFARMLTPPNLWENPFLHDSLGALGAARSYYLDEQKELESMLPSDRDSKLILAGVASCVLANQVLAIKWSNPEANETQLTIQCAKEVLKHWGLEIKGHFEPKPPAKKPEPEPATLTWPPTNIQGRPLHTVLPLVYYENYYHAREQTIGAPVNFSVATGEPLVAPEHLLTLIDAFWNEEKLQWRMRFTSNVHAEQFWLDHCRVQVGAEIPPKEPA